MFLIPVSGRAAENILNEKGSFVMDKVKRAIGYWCSDTRNKICTGKDVGVAILDTGLAPHPDFRGRVRMFKDCINHRNVPYDDSGHGTHVAGILAGSGCLSGGVLAGMAPEADLIIVKMLDQKGEGSVDQISEAVDWLKRNWRKYGIRIVNISVGAREGINREKEARIIQRVEELWDAGLVIIVSAGNFGPGKGTIAIPGTSRKVITVGALSDEKKGFCCSGEGPTGSCIVKPDVLAPGNRIISCNYSFDKSTKPYTVKSGTSMATPVVSGAMALLLSKYPEMSNVELKLKLRQSSRRIIDGRMNGWGAIRVDALLE